MRAQVGVCFYKSGSAANHGSDGGWDGDEDEDEEKTEAEIAQRRRLVLWSAQVVEETKVLHTENIAARLFVMMQIESLDQTRSQA